MVVQKERGRSYSYPLGMTVTPSCFFIKVIRKCERLYLNLYERNEEAPVERIEFPKESRIGDVWFLQVNTRLKKTFEYAFEDEKGLFPDEYGKCFRGETVSGKLVL